MTTTASPSRRSSDFCQTVVVLAAHIKKRNKQNMIFGLLSVCPYKAVQKLNTYIHWYIIHQQKVTTKNIVFISATRPWLWYDVWGPLDGRDPISQTNIVDRRRRRLYSRISFDQHRGIRCRLYCIPYIIYLCIIIYNRVTTVCDAKQCLYNSDI